MSPDTASGSHSISNTANPGKTDDPRTEADRERFVEIRSDAGLLEPKRILSPRSRTLDAFNSDLDLILLWLLRAQHNLYIMNCP